jgi:hypothetical protein
MDVPVENPDGRDEQEREHPATLPTEVVILFPIIGRPWQVYLLQLRSG